MKCLRFEEEELRQLYESYFDDEIVVKPIPTTKVRLFEATNKNLVPSCHFCAFLVRFLMILLTERGS